MGLRKFGAPGVFMARKNPRPKVRARGTRKMVGGMGFCGGSQYDGEETRCYVKSCLLTGLLFASLLTAPMMMAQAPADSASVSTAASIIGAEDAAKILPQTVFFRGLSAPVQARNSGGVRFADKRMMLVSLVDTSGYSTQVKEKYQAYLITETAIEIGGHHLAPGAYGCGFIADNVFVVQDIGAHDLFTAHSVADTDLRRPTPLQIVAAPGGDGYRLYAGRSYVTFRALK
jgi:hypothetical protein